MKFRDNDLGGLLWDRQTGMGMPERAARAVSVRQAKYTPPPPPMPDSNWSAPTELPDLPHTGRMAVDVETKDPQLSELGPGVRRPGNYVVGIAVGTDDGRRWYFPVRHEGGGNLDEGLVWRWAREELNAFRGTVLGANLSYDLDWLAENGVTFPNVEGFDDVQIAEPLIDEWRYSYSLDALAQDYLGERKVDGLLAQAAKAMGWTTEKQIKGNLWRLPASYVGAYAEGDVDLPLRIFPLQRAKLEAENLETVYSIERRLIPILVAMRRRGVRVDIEKTEAVRAQLVVERDRCLVHLRSIAGASAEFMQPGTFVKALQDRGLRIPLTPKTQQPSIKTTFFEQYKSDELVGVIARGRQVNTIINTFLDGHILGHHLNGRIHCVFNQLKNENGRGTIARLCLSGDTEIMVPGGTRQIQKMKKCDEVYCFDDEQRLTTSRVKWAGKTGLRPVYRVVFSKSFSKQRSKGSNQKSRIALLATGNHPIRMSNGKYKTVESLKKNDRVMALSREPDRGYTRLRIFGVPGRKSEHRMLFQIRNGYLPECVHHDDENRGNASKKNLKGMTRSEHGKHHMTRKEASRRSKLAWSRHGDKMRKASSEALTRYSKLKNPPEKMLKLFNTGKTISHIHDVMGASKRTIAKRLLELGVHPSRLPECYRPNNHHVDSVEVLPGLHEVYDLEVTKHHNFIANEVCVHNSSESPNLQNIPSRDKVIGPLIRGIFVPEQDEIWQKDDYSQVEYRLLTHFAIGTGAEEARQKYIQNPETDFHRFCMSMMRIASEDDVGRGRVKGVNFCKVYGGGIGKLAQVIGASFEDAEKFSNLYDQELPFVKETLQAAMKWAQKYGFVRDILGRRQRFSMWEPSNNRDRKMPPLPREKALEAYGPQIQRFMTYAALNRKNQASSATITKKAMVDAWEAGIQRVLGPPLTTVHDENNSSVPRTKEGDEAGRELTRIMERTVTLKVPLLVESKRGPNWGACK